MTMQVASTCPDCKGRALTNELALSSSGSYFSEFLSMTIGQADEFQIQSSLVIMALAMLGMRLKVWLNA